MLTHAKRSWDGKAKEPMPVNGDPVKQYSFALYLSHGANLAPRSVQATFVRCGTSGLCMLHKRLVKLFKKSLRLHNAVVHVKTRRKFRLYLTNLTDTPANLRKNFAVDLALPYDGPVSEDPLDELPMASEGAAEVVTLGTDPRVTPGEAHPGKSAGNQCQRGNFSPSQDRPKLDGVPPNPMPKVAYELIPPELHGAVRDLLERCRRL